MSDENSPTSSYIIDVEHEHTNTNGSASIDHDNLSTSHSSVAELDVPSPDTNQLKPPIRVGIY